MAVPAAGMFVGETEAAAVGDGALSVHAGTTARMVRLAYHLKGDTREDLEWLMIDGSYVNVHQHGTGVAGGNRAVGRTKGG